MTDNWTAAQATGGNVVFRADDVGSVLYQIVKLDGGDDSATIPILSPSSLLAALPVVVRRSYVEIRNADAISTLIYASGDMIGGVRTFANAVRGAGGTGTLRKVIIADADAEMAPMSLHLFSATLTGGTHADQGPLTLLDADLGTSAQLYLGSVDFDTSDYTAFANNAVAVITTEVDIRCVSTSLFGILITTGTPTYTATSDITITLGIVQD